MTMLPPRFLPRHVLGHGGMGEVWLAFDQARGEEVAIKVFRPAAGADVAEGRFLFKQEFWTARPLAHPHLVAVHDYGELADGTPYFTMEHVEGRDLAADRPMTEAEVAGWLPGVGAALAFLHAHGYVHGDLKPGNVRVRPDGTPKLMDLGLLTRSGRAGGPIRGTLAYLAPEAIRQGAVDARTDLYALGAVLYHLLAGRPPFAEADTLALLRSHLERRPEPLAAHAPAASPAMQRLVAALLAKDPAERPASVAEALGALGLPAPAEAGARLLASALVGREAATGMLAGPLERPEACRLAFVGPAGAGKSRLLAETRARAQMNGRPTFMAAGRGVCLSASRGISTTFKAVLFDETFARRGELELAGVPSRTQVSPGGRYAGTTVFVSGHSYAQGGFSTRSSVIDLATGQWLVEDLETFTVLRDGREIQSLDFNFWGITFARDERTFYATLGTAGETLLVKGDLTNRTVEVVEGNVECPSLSPDNRRIAFKHREGSGMGPAQWRLWVLDLDTRARTRLAETRGVDDQVQWLDNDRVLYALPAPPDRTPAMDQWAVPADGTGEPMRIVPDAYSAAAVR